jgi:uncharacterized repeat protein (TIGR03803 family)
MKDTMNGPSTPANLMKNLRLAFIPVIATAITLVFGPTLASGEVGFSVLKSFGHLDQGNSHPRGTLIEGDGGALYATSFSGGRYDLGTTFTLNRDGSGYAVIHDFAGSPQDGAQPSAGLLLCTDGMLFGTTYSGGLSNIGTVFKCGQDGTHYTTLMSFSGLDGAKPTGALVQESDGVLYGTTSAGGEHDLGTVFTLGPDGNGWRIIRSFAGIQGDGAHPKSGLILGRDGLLYGTTQNGGDTGNGTVFCLHTDGSGYAVIKSFGAAAGEGSEPYGGLVQGPDGALYGSTMDGGKSGQGTVFRLNSDGSGYAVLRVFRGTDGSNPYAALIVGTNEALYGTTFAGGAANQGTVFRMNGDGSGYALLKSFKGADGSSPVTSLLATGDGALYGATDTVGSALSGTVFKLNLDGSDFEVLKSFVSASSDGQAPLASLVQGSTGALYGTTDSGGTYGNGTVFRVAGDGSNYAVMWNFTGQNGEGAHPSAGLVLASNSVLYGSGRGISGPSDFGTVFQIYQDGTNYKVLKKFRFSDGAIPNGLVQGLDGALYGTTLTGGTSPSGAGTAFRLNSDGSGFRMLRSFTGTNGDGMNPYAGLIQASNRILYGTTAKGGSNNLGSVFRLNPDGTDYLILKSFSGSDGANPAAALLQAQDGLLYGTTVSGGAFGSGVIFRLNLDGTDFVLLESFPDEGGQTFERPRLCRGQTASSTERDHGAEVRAWVSCSNSTQIVAAMLSSRPSPA